MAHFLIISRLETDIEFHLCCASWFHFCFKSVSLV